MAIGAALTIAGARALIRHGTNVNPLRSAITLATNGIYRWTRNPMYDGGAPMMNQISYQCGQPIVLVLRPPVLYRHVAAFNVTTFA